MQAEALLRRLADGQAHSGEDLARDFGVTRAAIWKHIGKLKDWGLELHAVPGRGYCLTRPVDLIDESVLRAQLSGTSAAPVQDLEVFVELESTNRHLLGRPAPAPGRMALCIAEYQTAGRGRRGRGWTAPLGAGLCLSVAWQFPETPPQLSALSLAIGVVARRVLDQTAGVQIALKWPNDLIWHTRKLGGVLVELIAEAQAGCHVVVGLGINVSMSPELLARVSDWPSGATDLYQATNGATPSRTTLTAALVRALGEMFLSYQRDGFGPFHSEWCDADYLEGKLISLDEVSGSMRGTASGIEPDGALLLEAADGSRRRIISGDISVRPAT